MMVFAKMLLIIGTEIPLGTIHINHKTFSSEKEEPDIDHLRTYYKESLINFAIDIMCSTSSYRVVAKYLLELGHVVQAISIYANGLSSLKNFQLRNASSTNQLISSFQDQYLPEKEAHDFFKAAIHSASNIKDIGDRSKLFYFLYCFLCQYNPESIMAVNS